MTPESPAQKPRPKESPKLRVSPAYRPIIWAGLSLTGLLALGIGFRVPIAESLIRSGLESQGVPARLKLHHLGWHEAEGSFTIEAANPTHAPKAEFIRVGQFHVEYDVNLWHFISGNVLGLQALKLDNLDVGLSFKNNHFGFKPLDQMIRKMMATPSTYAPPRLIQIDGLHLALDTDFGLVKGEGRMRVDNGMLSQFELHLLPGQFASTEGAIALSEGQITATTDAHKMIKAGLSAHIASASRFGIKRQPNDVVSNLTLIGAAQFPATTGTQARPFSANIVVKVDRLFHETWDAAGLSLTSDLTGQYGTDRFSLKGPIQIKTDSLKQGQFSLKKGEGIIHLDAAAEKDLTRIEGHGRVLAPSLAYTGFGPKSAHSQTGSADATKQMADFANGFALVGSDISVNLEIKPAATLYRLNFRAPLHVSNGHGTGLEVRGIGNAPILASNSGGGLNLTTHGPGLPRLEAILSRLKWTPQGLDSDFGLITRLNQAPFEGAEITPRGHFRMTDKGVEIALNACMPVHIARADLGLEVREARFTLCSTGATFARLASKGWQAQGRFETLSLFAPDLMTRLEAGHGPFQVVNIYAGNHLTYRAGLDKAKLTDRSDSIRFQPLNMSGTMVQSTNGLIGDFAFNLDAALAR